jgi:O-antigen/teichoic acid export membrane protein
MARSPTPLRWERLGGRASRTMMADAPDRTPRDIHRLARRSLSLVVSRQLLITGLSFASGVVLARALTPADFGVFAIATFVVGFAGLLADLGLHSALVQRAVSPVERDLQTAFTLHQVSVFVAMTALWLVASWLPAIYRDAPPDLVGLVRLMSLDLLFMSWCRPSEALIERGLRYERLVPIDVTVTAVYAIVAITLALSGAGVWSFGVAFVAATATRFLFVYRVAPWPIRPAFDIAAARELLATGLPLQVGRVVAQAQYWIAPTLVAGTIGPAAAGLLQWAAGNGRKPLELLEYLARVSLPHFSRLQHDEGEVERTLVRYVALFVLVCGLWLSVLAVAGRDLVTFVYTVRWLPAVTAMVLFAAVGLLVSVRIIVTAALAGLGRTQHVARVGVAAALTTIIASVPLVLALGPIGVPLGQLAGAAAVLPFLISGLGAGVTRRVAAAAATAVVPMLLAAVAGLAARAAPLDAELRGLLTAAVATLAYTAGAWWAGPRWIRDAAREELDRL